MKYLLIICWSLLLAPMHACTQPNPELIGGPCEDCAAINESPIAFEKLKYSDTISAYYEPGSKLHIRGTVFKADGKTPAPAVIIYFYHTDAKGIYATRGDEKGWGKRHGFLRGWLKTNEKGEYEFFTIRPASYPNTNNPQHIHMTIKEPGKKEYWIDEIHFTDDPVLTNEAKQHFRDRGGSGLITLRNEKNMYRGERNIVLGKNVPGYY